MALKLINGLFYYEHKLDVDNKALIDEIIYTRENPSDNLNQSRPHHLEMDEQHTFYEDVPLKEDTFDLLNTKVNEVTDQIFGIKNAMYCCEIWGHVVNPGEQTMIHTHHEKDSIGLSWVYYPHMPVKSGNLVFIANADQQRIMWEIKSTPGTLYLFSRDILHFTPRNASKEIRVSISGNCASNPELSSILNNDVEFKNNYWYFTGRDGENILNNE
jgi:hypothetical protein|tara:strand:- start:152 stop:796 length:645 start_codon:yes stop_codon:yes gene_type:complete